MNLLPFLLIFALINSCIELEISAPSFPSIMSYFGVAENIVGLTITTNLIGFCIAASIYGPLSDVFGRRRIMLIGNGILTLGAIGCVVTPSIFFLLFTRFIQGLGAATSAVVVSAIIADRYKTKEASKLYGLMNAVFTILMALAPVMGGFINNAIGWRGNYGVIALISGASWFLLMAFLPETIKEKHPLKFKKISANYKTLLASQTFLCAAIVPSMLYGCYMAFIAISPFIYIEILQLSMIAYTLNTAIVVFSFAIISSIAGKITDFMGTPKTLLMALGLQVMGPLLLCFATDIFSLTFSMSLFSIGFALIYPIVFSRSMEIFPNIKGTASSAIMSLRYMICAGLTAIISFVYNGTIASLAGVLLISAVLTLALSLFLLKEGLFIFQTRQ